MKIRARGLVPAELERPFPLRAADFHVFGVGPAGTSSKIQIHHDSSPAAPANVFPKYSGPSNPCRLRVTEANKIDRGARNRLASPKRAPISADPATPSALSIRPVVNLVAGRLGIDPQVIVVRPSTATARLPANGQSVPRPASPEHF